MHEERQQPFYGKDVLPLRYFFYSMSWRVRGLRNPVSDPLAVSGATAPGQLYRPSPSLLGDRGPPLSSDGLSPRQGGKNDCTASPVAPTPSLPMAGGGVGAADHIYASRVPPRRRAASRCETAQPERKKKPLRYSAPNFTEGFVKGEINCCYSEKPLPTKLAHEGRNPKRRKTRI